MQLRQLLDDDSAVSPVIGVILMVAITVILAAVIATFVLGLGEQISSTAPQASFNFEYDSSTSPPQLTIVHNGGDTIAAGNLYVRGSSATTGTNTGDWDTITDGDSTDYGSDSQIRAGFDVTINVQSSDTVRVIYEPSGGGSSATLGVWEGPDA